MLVGGCAANNQYDPYSSRPSTLSEAGKARVLKAATEIGGAEALYYIDVPPSNFSAGLKRHQAFQVCSSSEYSEEACTKAWREAVKYAASKEEKRIKGIQANTDRINAKDELILLNRMDPLMGKLVRRGLLTDGTATGEYQSPAGRFTLEGEDLPERLLPDQMPPEHEAASITGLKKLIGQMRETSLANITPEEAVELYAAKRLGGEASPPRQVAGGSRSNPLSEPLYLEIDPSRIKRGGTDFDLDGGSYTIESGETRICLPVRRQVGDGACFVAVRRDRNVQLCDPERINCTQQLSLPVGNVRRVTPLSRNLRVPTSLGNTEPVSVTLAGDELPGSFRYNLPGGFQGGGGGSRPAPVITDRRLGRCTYNSTESRSGLPVYLCKDGKPYLYDGSRFEPLRQGGRRN